MKVYFLGFSLCCLILFCSCSKAKESDSIKYEEIGATSKDKTKTKLTDTVVSEIPKDSFDIRDLGIQIKKVEKIETHEFLDRFENINTDKRLLIGISDSIFFKTWIYKDSLTTLNAFYNLLDCFGPECNIIELYSESYSNPSYNLVFVSEQKIQWIHSNTNQSISIWDKYLREKSDLPIYYFIMEQRRTEKMRWLEQNYRTNTFKIIRDNTYGIIK